MSLAAERQFFNLTLPRAAQLVGTAGQPCVIALTANTPIAINLSQLFTQPPPALTAPVTTSTAANPNTGVGMLATSSAMGSQPAGVVGFYLTITPEGTDIGVITGVQEADVSNNLSVGGPNNAPDLGITGTLSSGGVIGSGTNGLYTAAAKSCGRIFDGQPVRVRPLLTQDIWLGVVAVQSGLLRIYQSTIAGGSPY